ncbi:hypothetical protein [Corynebacterium sp.]|uniref:hypothetical protein n=1 Tax=Corynebacterium sp. TaxID=1720 RepID=UPI0026DB48EB|nr:hypothetical protein [Corynebacterium sp.]MDO5075920.1 hypothetical protein [Corynebacterium sp.]
MAHFELTGETCEYRGRTLRRIRALKFLRHCGVLPGVLGGWVEQHENLADDAWVADDAKVYGEASITDEAVVCGTAEVYEHAQVRNRSKVSGQAKIYGNAMVSGDVTDNAQVFGNATVWRAGPGPCLIAGDARVFENARVFGQSWVGDHARLFGCASVQAKARVGGMAGVFENATVADQAWVSGQSQVFGNAQLAGQCWVHEDGQVFENSRVFGQAQVLGRARVYGHAWVSGLAAVEGDAQVFGYAQLLGKAHVCDGRQSGTARVGEDFDLDIPDALTIEELDARAGQEFTDGVFVFDSARQCFVGGFESTFYFDHVGPNTYREVLRYCEGREVEPEPGTEMYFTGSPRQLKAAVLARHTHAAGFLGYPVVFDKKFVTLFVGDLEVP